MDIATLGLIGVVILVAALLSGVVERTRFPQVALFLLLGLALGPLGMGLVHFGLNSPVLETLATLGLVLVLFTDATRECRSSRSSYRPQSLLSRSISGYTRRGSMTTPATRFAPAIR